MPPVFPPGSSDLSHLQWELSSKTVIAGLPARGSISGMVVVLKSDQIHPLGRSGMSFSIFRPILPKLEQKQLRFRLKYPDRPLQS